MERQPTPIEKVLTQCVLENANLKIRIAGLEEEIEGLRQELDSENLGDSQDEEE